ncbi:MAG: dihydrolipoyl dehydrogenase, partial [Alphaproteobacteria bacterium]|nr:dihydrolipoyl dehydrogenase [Alphaproteobacteria bacterium]
MADTQFDVIIIGGGPGGYVSAIRGSQLGLKVCVVEKKHLGGICLNWGCIPTKALLRSAEIYHNMNHAEDYGLSAKGVGFDLKKIIERSRGVSGQLSSGVAYLLKKNKVTVVDGEAKLAGPGKVDVSKDGKALPQLSAKHVIVATGARPRALPGLEPDGKLVWTYFEALNPDIMPKTLLVIGSGAIGIEFASFFRTLGADVTVVEILPQILPVEDAEIAAAARKQLETQGMKILTGAKVAGLKKSKNSVTASIEDENGKTSEIKVDRVISAVGVVGNIEGIGLETTKAKTDRGCIVVDEFSRTAEPGLYAIGDVAGPPMLAHKAEHEGVICIEKIAGLTPHPLNKRQIPGCTYCHPQIASVGLTESQAKEAGYALKVGRFPFMANGKAIALGEPDGLVKTIFDAKTGQLLGAHMVGAEVTELIQGFVVAMGLETTEEELMHTVFPHPTLSEMMHESVLDAF